jgi:major vault protein
MANQHAVLRIKPNHYIHVLDNNTNVTSVVIGPKTFTRQEHEQVLFGPDPMIMIPPRHYCIISNPIGLDEEGNPIFGANGQVKLRHGDEEIRFAQDPFPLYPGERMTGKPSPLQVVQSDQGLKLRCIRNFVDKEEERQAGDEWIFRGPATYIPRIEVQVVEVVRSIIIKENQALKLRAKRDCKDVSGNQRIAGEEWLVRESGAYLPEIDEETVGTISAHTLTPNTALHLRAIKSFVDNFKKERAAGDEWLVTLKDTETHLPDVYEQVVSVVKITVLTDRQFCVVLDPVDDKTGKQKLGVRELRVGEVSFFLKPGERLEAGIQEIYVLGEEEALLLRARLAFDDESGEKRKAGDKWMVSGPCDFIPPIEVEVVERRKSLPLDENEGIYIRDIRTGKVRAEIGHTYMLKAYEELWSKDLPQSVDILLKKSASRDKDERNYSETVRDLTKVVSYRVPHNAAVQIYDYKKKESRVVYGPELVMLGPDEQFTVMDLSGGVPKKTKSNSKFGFIFRTRFYD